MAASFSFSGGLNKVSIIQGNSVTFSWNLSGGYNSASITNHGTLTESGSSKTYKIQAVYRYVSASPAPGDHFCSTSNPGGGYSLEGPLFWAFTEQAPGTGACVDKESPGIKPTSEILGYVYISGSPPTGLETTTIYEKIDPAGGPPTGLGTIWTRSASGEKPYTEPGPLRSFITPDNAYTDYSGISYSGSATKKPTATTIYKLTASGPDVDDYTKSITVTVLIPPTVNFTSDATSIKLGNSTTLRWTTSGDANTLTWIANGFPNTLLTSQQSISPLVTTTYILQVSGAGGTSPEYSVKIVVYAPPEGELIVPTEIDYKVPSFDIEWSTKYANTQQNLRVTIIDLDGNKTIENIPLTPLAASADTGAADTDTERSGTYTYKPTWGDRGPLYIKFRLNVEGDGGKQTFPDGPDEGDNVNYYSTFVNIDQTPNNIIIPNSLDLLKGDPDVRTPLDGIKTDMLLIDDIDIPVEIKSSNPILVRIDNTGEWNQLRSYGVPAEPVGGIFDGPEEEEEFVEETVSSQEEFVEEFVEETVSSLEKFVDMEVVEANPIIVRTTAGTLELNTGKFTIDLDVAYIQFKIWGGGGAGENVDDSVDPFIRTSGGDGTASTFLGLTAGGGNKGKQDIVDAGKGGIATDDYGWGSRGVSLNMVNGTDSPSYAFPTISNITDNGGGTGVKLGNAVNGSGGNGSTGSRTYTSSSDHFFNNATNKHNFDQSGSTADISLSYVNPRAVDGISGDMPTNGKYYNLRFITPYVNNTWTFSISGVCNQAAGGGTKKKPYTYQGYRYKSSRGISLWFQNKDSINGYIRCFTITTTGIKYGVIGMGGGGGAAISGTITRKQFQDSETYALGTTHDIVSGGGGDGETTANDGGDGLIELYVVYKPKIEFYEISAPAPDPKDPYTVEIKKGQCVTFSWRTIGDADTFVWTAGNLSNTFLTSTATVCPVETTEYTARANGIGGFSDLFTLTVNVFELPTGSVDAPEKIKYGVDTFDIKYTVNYANIKNTLEVTYDDIDEISTDIETIELEVNNTALTNSKPDDYTRTETLTYKPTWGDRGPLYIKFRLNVEGDGGKQTFPDGGNYYRTFVEIDQTPNNIIIPKSLDLLKGDPDVRSPLDGIKTDMLLIDDIDIPVEIKSSNPILVRIDNTGEWTKLRSYGVPAEPVGGIFDGPEEEEEFVEEVQESVSSRSISEELQVVEADPVIVKTSDHGDVDYANLITCISIIDESTPSVATHRNDWTSFRNNYPNRTFYLLQATFRKDPPQSNPRFGIDRLNRPSNFLNDPYAYTVQVNRDDQTSNISNWFNICGLQNVPAGSYVSVWLDISGSMKKVDVKRSYSAFEVACQNAGIEIILETSDKGERWIPGHNKDLPPSGFITADKTSVKENEEFELTWVAFGEVTQVTITNYNGGNPVTFTGHDDLTITATTTFTMTIRGKTGGTETRSVTVTLIPKPVFNIWLLNDPTIQEIVRKPNVSTQINWTTTPAGSGTSLTWSSGNISNTLLTSQTSVQLLDSSTFCGTVTGPGGTSETVCATITVSQYVTLKANAPDIIDYNTETITLDYSTEYSDVEMKLEVFFTYLDGSTSPKSVFTDDTLPHPDSFELNPVAPAFNSVDGEEVEFDMSTFWNDIGPSSIKFRFTAKGAAGTKVVNLKTLVNIDQTPNNIIIPNSLDLLNGDPDVRSPLDGIKTDMLYINDIDVPVEIKSSNPILVRIDNTGEWNQLRSYGVPAEPVGGIFDGPEEEEEFVE